MDNRIKQYLFDIENSIQDVNSYISSVGSFTEYEKDKMIRRAVEREIEIIYPIRLNLADFCPIGIPSGHKKMATLFVENTRQNLCYACVFLLDIHHFFLHILSANPKRPEYR